MVARVLAVVLAFFMAAQSATAANVCEKKSDRFITISQNDKKVTFKRCASGICNSMGDAGGYYMSDLLEYGKKAHKRATWRAVGASFTAFIGTLATTGGLLAVANTKPSDPEVATTLLVLGIPSIITAFLYSCATRPHIEGREVDLAKTAIVEDQTLNRKDWEHFTTIIQGILDNLKPARFQSCEAAFPNVASGSLPDRNPELRSTP